MVSVATSLRTVLDTDLKRRIALRFHKVLPVLQEILIAVFCKSADDFPLNC